MTSQIDDYFTNSILGAPAEVSLGTQVLPRLPKNEKYVTVHAVDAKVWVSDPARQALKMALKKSKLQVERVGLPFSVNKPPWHHNLWLNVTAPSFFLPFLMGFGMCLVCVSLALIARRLV